MPSIAAAEQSVTLTLSSDAYVDIGTDIGIDFTNRSTFTIEGWFHFTGLCPDSKLFEKSGQFVFGTNDKRVYASFVGQPMPLVTDKLLDTETDFHLAVTYDGYTLSLFVNGLLTVSASFQFSPPQPNQKPCFIGQGFQGYCRYLRLWSTPRSQTQIFKNEWTYSISDTNLQADYAFFRYPARDLSGKNRSLTFRQGAQSEITAPVVIMPGSAYCEPLDASQINPGGGGTDDYTILAWVMLETLGKPQAILCNGELRQPGGIILYVDTDGKVVAKRGPENGASIKSSTAIFTNRWYSIGYTYHYDNASQSGAQTLYINGTNSGTAVAGSIQTLPGGKIILGAAKSTDTANQIMNLEGYMQFISVWNTALSTTEINDWMYNDPTSQSNCIANYSFTSQTSQNLVDGSPVALVNGANLVILRVTSYGYKPPSEIRTGKLPVENPCEDFSPKRMVKPQEPDNISNTNLSITTKTFALMDNEFLHALPNKLPNNEHHRLLAEFNKVKQQLKENPDKASFHIEQRIIDDYHTLIYRRDDFSEIIFHAHVSTIDECTVWKIKVVVTELIAIFGVFLPFLQAGPVTNWLGERINTIGFWPQVNAVLTAGVTPGSFLKILKLIYEFGWLSSVCQLLVLQLSWWDIFVIFARLLMLVTPGVQEAQIAYFLISITVSIASVVNVWNERPDGC